MAWGWLVNTLTHKTPDSSVSARPADYEDQLGLGEGKALPFRDLLPREGSAMPSCPRALSALEPLASPLPCLSAD